jgi:tetratricopeptide (TPR) repeat protein
MPIKGGSEMENNKSENKSGITLAKNPLGIISLFVFFIEAIATVSLNIAVNTDYIGHIVWFIILFPTLIVLLFFFTLWVKRESLYSPMEFRDDESFLLLLKKVDRLEAKQDAAELDPVTADLAEVFATIDRLLGLNDVRSAIEVGRAYLKQNQYEESTKIFSYMQSKVNPQNEAYYKILANLSYSLIGTGKYTDAIKNMIEVHQIRNGAEFRAWHALAIAYSYFMIGETKKFEEWLADAKMRAEYKRNILFFQSLYPEIKGDL